MFGMPYPIASPITLLIEAVGMTLEVAKVIVRHSNLQRS